MRSIKLDIVQLVRLLVIVAGCLLCSAPAALADDAGDDIAQATGPLVGGTVYNGILETTDDVDWYVVYTNPQVALDIAITAAGDGCPVNAVLLDADGKYVSGVQQATATSGQTVHLGPFTTATTPTRYYVRVKSLYTDCTGDTYQLLLTPATSVTTNSPLIATAPGPGALPTGEPNDMRTQAFGPLLGGTAYAGQFDTVNDPDWFVFYTAPQQPLDIAITKIGDGCSTYISAELFDSDGMHVEGEASGASISSDQTDHLNFTTPLAAARYYLELGPSNCVGNDYQLRADPAGSLLPALPPPDQDGDGVPDGTDKCPTKAAPTASGCRGSFVSRVSFKRNRARYSGRVTSTSTACLAKRRVHLRKTGHGTHSYRSTTTITNGSFAFALSKRMSGSLYAVVDQTATPARVCRVAKSKTIRG
jgi:hypothetical protein